MAGWQRYGISVLVALGLLSWSVDPAAAFSNRVTIVNSCAQPLWITALSNAGEPALQPADGLVRIASGQSHPYAIPDGHWGGQFRPKFGCDASGNNCSSGQSLPPCPAGGCQPPAESKIEFYFPTAGANPPLPFFDVSLVDGFTLKARITPSVAASGNCTPFTCNLDFDDCPTNEAFGLGNLKVMAGGQPVMCLSPCKKWSYPPPYGLGNPETQGIGRELCCAGGISARDCNAGRVVQTQYVQTLRQKCPSSYSFAYDDQGGTHACPLTTNFTVTFCP